MKKNIQFLWGQSILLFFMIIFMDWTYVPKFALWFLWCLWTVVISICYASIWRESVDCRCLEKVVEE